MGVSPKAYTHTHTFVVAPICIYIYIYICVCVCVRSYVHTYVSREMLKHLPKPTTWDWGAGVATYSQVCLPAETAYSIMVEVKGKIHSPPQGCSHLLNTVHCSARLETGMNRHVNQASWAGLQRLIYDDVMKTRAVALESDCTIETQQHSRENHCGAYSRIRGERNSFKPGRRLPSRSGLEGGLAGDCWPLCLQLCLRTAMDPPSVRSVNVLPSMTPIECTLLMFVHSRPTAMTS